HRRSVCGFRKSFRAHERISCHGERPHKPRFRHRNRLRNGIRQRPIHQPSHLDAALTSFCRILAEFPMHQPEQDKNDASNKVEIENKNERVAGAQPPLEKKGAERYQGGKTAAGLRAIYETARVGLREMGVARSFQTLLKVNQKDGFDCPSCAWPDPDGHRNTAEFCENGAKAVSSEATTKRLTPEAFGSLSI